MQKPSQPLSNVQLEILKAFSHQLDQQEILEFREIIAQYFAKRAIQAANKVWDEKGWTDETVERLLHTRMRKEKNSK